jgi:hypothetical protein
VVEVALYQARREREFLERVIVVRLDEDVVGLGSYRDVLREILNRVPVANGSERKSRPADPEAAIAEALGDRVLVLVVENLDRLFAALGASGQQDLRAWIETSRSVMLLATAPLLFSGVQDRNQPWYGNLGITHLEELTVEDGVALLEHLARENGDEALARFLRTDRGLARLEAINVLAGGSPRVWMILSDCISVELLDELTPAVEALMESLVPYYQQMLWDLSVNEQRLVRALANGSVQSMTVTMLSESTDIDQRSAATSLGRLAKSRWVRAEKPEGVDHRATWYRLREPLLRHHLQYRSAGDQPLRLIVDLLRAWFDPIARRAHLLDSEPGSSREILLAGSLNLDLNRFDSAYSSRDVNALLVDSRRWVHGAESQSRTPEAGALIEFAVLLIKQGPDAAQRSLESRVRAGAMSDILGFAEAVDVPGAGLETDRVGSVLTALAQRRDGRTHVILELISACWDGTKDSARTRDRVRRLLDAFVEGSDDDVLKLQIRSEEAYWTGRAGDLAVARDHYAAVLTDYLRVLGADHPDTLIARRMLAYGIGKAGDASAASAQYAAVLTDYLRVFGADHPDTLEARRMLAYWTGKAGDATVARDQDAAVLTDCLRVLGADHPDTLEARGDLAYWTGEAGDATAARDQYAAVLTDYPRVLGADHPDTLGARRMLGYWTGEAGDATAARDQYAAVLTDCLRVLGADHPDTLGARRMLAYWTGEAGDATAARDQYAAVLTDYPRVLGADHPDTLAARGDLAHWTGEAGDATAAREQYAALLVDTARILGVESSAAIKTSIVMSNWTRRAGRPAEAAQDLLALLGSHPVASASLRAEIDEAIGLALLEVLTRAVEGGVEPIDMQLPEASFLADLQAAAKGEYEATARIPSELRTILAELQKRSESELGPSTEDASGGAARRPRSGGVDILT